MLGKHVKHINLYGREFSGIVEAEDDHTVVVRLDNGDIELFKKAVVEVVPPEPIERLFLPDGRGTPTCNEICIKIHSFIEDLITEYPNVDYHDLQACLFQAETPISRAILDRRYKRGEYK